jgi:hypothetical protein
MLVQTKKREHKTKKEGEYRGSEPQREKATVATILLSSASQKDQFD